MKTIKIMNMLKIFAFSAIFVVFFVFNIMFTLTNCAFGAPDAFFRNEKKVTVEKKAYSDGPIVKKLDDLHKRISGIIVPAILNKDKNDIERIIDDELSKKQYINAVFIRRVDGNLYSVPDRILIDETESDFLYAKFKPDYKSIMAYDKKYHDFINGLYMKLYYIKDQKKSIIAQMFVFVSFNDGTWK
jgi:hypothetical protein